MNYLNTLNKLTSGENTENKFVTFFYFIEFAVLSAVIEGGLFIGLMMLVEIGGGEAGLALFPIILLFVFGIIPIIVSIMVYKDAKKLKEGGVVMQSPSSWLFICILFNIVGWSTYFALRRSDYKKQLNNQNITPSNSLNTPNSFV